VRKRFPISEASLRRLIREALDRRADAREHDRWFRDEVQRALAEADDPATVRIDNDDIEAAWRQRRSALLQRSAQRRPPAGA
jgi:hypothetical protein